MLFFEATVFYLAKLPSTLGNQQPIMTELCSLLQLTYLLFTKRCWHVVLVPIQLSNCRICYCALQVGHLHKILCGPMWSIFTTEYAFSYCVVCSLHTLCSNLGPCTLCQFLLPLCYTHLLPVSPIIHSQLPPTMLIIMLTLQAIVNNFTTF